MHPFLVAFYGFMIWAMSATGLLVFIMWRMGPEGRFFLGSSFKRGHSILALHTGGITEYQSVKEDEGYLIGNPRNFYFLPELIKLNNSPKKDEEKKEVREKGKFNDLIKHRSILRGQRKPIYHASQATCIAANPELLSVLEETSCIKDLKKQVEDEKAEIIVPWSIDKLTEYVQSAYPISKQKRSHEEGYLRGLGYREKKNYMKFVIPIIGIVVFGFMIYLLAGSDFFQRLVSTMQGLG